MKTTKQNTRKVFPKTKAPELRKERVLEMAIAKHPYMRTDSDIARVLLDKEPGETINPLAIYRAWIKAERNWVTLRRFVELAKFLDISIEELSNIE